MHRLGPVDVHREAPGFAPAQAPPPQNPDDAKQFQALRLVAPSGRSPCMTEDPRCCGSGTCIIDDDGHCWCGQRWNGQRMCAEPLQAVAAPAPQELPDSETGGPK